MWIRLRERCEVVIGARVRKRAPRSVRRKVGSWILNIEWSSFKLKSNRGTYGRLDLMYSRIWLQESEGGYR